MRTPSVSTSWLSTLREASFSMKLLKEVISQKKKLPSLSDSYCPALLTATTTISCTEISSPRTFCLRPARSSTRSRLLTSEQPRTSTLRSSLRSRSALHITSRLRFLTKSMAKNAICGVLVSLRTSYWAESLHLTEVQMVRSCQQSRRANIASTTKFGVELQRQPRTLFHKSWPSTKRRDQLLSRLSSTNGSKNNPKSQLTPTLQKKPLKTCPNSIVRHIWRQLLFLLSALTSPPKPSAKILLVFLSRLTRMVMVVSARTRLRKATWFCTGRCSLTRRLTKCSMPLTLTSPVISITLNSSWLL